MEDKTIKVTARMVFGQTMGIGVPEREKRYAAVIIEDRASGIQIAELRMDPQELMSFMSGGSTRLEMDWTSTPERIGMEMEHERNVMPYSAFKDQADAEAAAAEWADANGWESVSVRRNNVSDWVIIGRRWVAPSNKES